MPGSLSPRDTVSGEGQHLLSRSISCWHCIFSSAKRGRNLRVVNCLLCARLKAKCFVDIVSLNFKVVSKVKRIQLCPTLCDPMDCSLPGSSVHGIFQARILEWVALFPSPGDLSNPGIELRSPTLHADSLPSEAGSLLLSPFYR